MADIAPTASEDREAQRQAQTARKWIAELTLSEKYQRAWVERAKKITKRYKSENTMEDAPRRFAMLWSNTETIKPAVYSRPPQPVVTRRFLAEDPVARAASEILERSLSATIDLQDLDARLKTLCSDFVLVGRAQSWVRYVPTHGPQITPRIPLQPVTEGEGVEEYADDDGNIYERERVLQDETGFYAEDEPYSPVVYEEAVTDYVNWEDFGHSPARTWDEVSYVWRRVYLSREQLIERFGENLGKLVPLDWGPIQQGQRDVAAELAKKAAIYEIWCKTTKRVYWISKSYGSRPLDEREDPLGLSGFFPCPRPLLATTGSDSVIPVPDFVYYQSQAQEIDRLTERIQQLQEAIKVRGFYAADQKTNLNNMFNSSNNILIPVPDWVKIKEGGGVSGNIEWFPIQMVVGACDALIAQRQQLIQDVYQITGVADVLRGMNDPRATATAERIKGAWGTLRIRTKQVEMQRFARDALRLAAEVIAEKFEIDTLRAMSGVNLPTAEEKAQAQAIYDQGAAQYQQAVEQAQAMGQQPPPPPQVPPQLAEVLESPTWEDVVALLRDNAARSFRVDIETDSTIEPDEAEQKAQAVEFLGAVGNMISQAGAAVAAQPALAPLMGEMIKWGARRFRAGRELEDIIDRTIDQIVEQGAQQPQGEAAAPPPDKTPVEVAQINFQREQVKQQGENQRAAIEAQVQQGDQAIRAQDNELKVIMGGRDPVPQVSV